MSGLTYYAYDNDPYNSQGFNSNSNNFAIFNNNYNSTGTITTIENSNDTNSLYSTYGFSTNQSIALKFQGYFTPNVTGNWGFLLGDIKSNLANDDISYLWIGENALNPTSSNANGMCYWYTSFSSCYIYTQLTAGVSYPILMYYGQGNGGFAVSLGIIPPGGSVTYDGSSYFSTSSIVECTSTTPTWTFQESFGGNWYTLKQNGFSINWSNLGITSNINMSISFWLNITSLYGNWRNILHLTNNNNDCCNNGDRIPGIWITPSGSSLYISNSISTNYNDCYQSGSLPINQQQFITIVWSGTNVYVYVNATLFYQYTYPSPLTTATSNAIFYIGDPWYDTNGGLLIKDFSMYNCCLSQSNIALIYNSEQSNSCSYQLSSAEQQCYKNNYPQDLSSMNGQQLQSHWSNTGCNQGRSNQCPSQQTTSGKYTYTGCYNDTGVRAIPNEQKNVTSVDECAKIAEKKNQNVFGVQYNGQCFTGANIEEAYQYGANFNSSSCPSLGGSWTNQVYVRNQPFDSGPITPPQLSSINFGTKESFSNNTIKQFTMMMILTVILLFIIYYFLHIGKI